MNAHRSGPARGPSTARRVGRVVSAITWVAFGILLSFTFTGIFGGTPLHRALNIAAIAVCVLLGLLVWIADERREAVRRADDDRDA